jgi:hypothetical protein
VSETQSPEEIVEDVEQAQDRLAETVEALAYKKGHAKDDVKEAVVEKKDAVVAQVKDKVAEKKEDVVGTIKDKVADTKDDVSAKVGNAKDVVASKLPGGGSDDASSPSGKEGLSSKVADAKDAVVAKLGDLKDAVAEKLPGGDEATGGNDDGSAAAQQSDLGQDLPPGVEVIAVDEQGRPESHDDQVPSSTAQELRGLAGELRARGQADAAELATDQAVQIEHDAGSAE